MEDITIKIPNFKISVFKNLIAQSLMVNPQLMLEFSPDMIKSCSFTITKSLMKLWTTPLGNLIHVEEPAESLDDLDLTKQLNVAETPEQAKLDFPVFNFYILKGDLFSRYISVHNSDTVDLEFILHKTPEGKYQAANITITGLSETSSALKTTFILTTENLISNKIDDYSLIIKHCTPSPDMFEFVLTNHQIQEVKRLIKNLHKSTPGNTAYFTITVNVEKQIITINDKAFTIDFVISQSNQNTLPEKSFSFNILKSDFIMTGNHTFSIYTNETDQKIILGTTHANAIIWCLSSKLVESNNNFDDSIMDSTIDDLDIDEYVDDLNF